MTAGPRRTLLGIALMLGAMLVLPFLDVCAKLLGRQGVPIIEIVWARMVFGAALTLPFALRIAGPRALLPDRPVYHLLRATFLLAATGCFFWALRYQSIADTLAIFFVQPLIVTMLSPLVLGETVGARRWAAVVAGFIGILIIIRPGFAAMGLGTLLALGAGTSLAIYMLMTRKLSGTTHAMVTTFYTSLMGAGLASLAVVPFWQTPSLPQWGLFVLLAFIAAAGHYLIVRAYDYCEASLLAPLAYTEMIMATVAGWYFFDDFPDTWTFVGVGILIGCAIYISLTERSQASLADREFEQP